MFSYRHQFEKEPFYINEKYVNNEPLYIEDSTIFWEIKFIENDCGILILKPVRKLIAIENNEIIIEAKAHTYAKLDVSTIGDDKPILVDWINEVWRILDKYWKNGVPIYALKPMKELNVEDCAEAILIDLKDYGFYL